MRPLLVVDTPDATALESWQTVTADEYLSAHPFIVGPYGSVINLCATDKYQGKGFYVSLVAEARGHHPIPSVKTIEDLHSVALPALLDTQLAQFLPKLFQAEAGDAVQIDIYFGQDPSGQHSALAQQIFSAVKAPLLRVRFARVEGSWRVASIGAMSLGSMPPSGLRSLCASLEQHYPRPKPPASTHRSKDRPRVAILHEGKQADAPSDAAAIDSFVRAGIKLGMDVEIVDRGVEKTLTEYDALFLRETTHLNHYTYDLARTASAAGMVVIDDPDSILQCNNKVFLHELLTRHSVPTPHSLTVHRGNVDQIVATVGLPCVLKQPDGAFSLGVSKVETGEELHAVTSKLLQKSDLIIAQAFLPTAFDWRIGMLDRRPLFACRYFMAPNHWQIIKRDRKGRTEGQAIAVAIGEAPRAVIDIATRAANLIGGGFYGVDIKETQSGCFVMEVNDNPNVDAGNEDGVLRQALYREVMAVIRRRVVEERVKRPVALSG